MLGEGVKRREGKKEREGRKDRHREERMQTT
jgi:hypothetical protein